MVLYMVKIGLSPVPVNYNVVTTFISLKSCMKRKMAAAASESSSKKRKGTPNRRWTKDMDDVLIPCLAEQAKAGMKVDKSFKRVAFVEAAKVVNDKITGSNMDADNVENRLCTLKIKYQESRRLWHSRVGWNDMKENVSA
ncbi:hypothetical protein J5N97_000421 [Dioscorea zingiberensis]|uniref:Myb/SANT-like domain-containing protein n=1 Tax=Dioscorea zingiberensis TaxID=325984 RepID=A0A9D5BVM9_9LILI|nr:hypothetical protein J5N97_000421 [Dioscorea zingiberensis]